MSRENPTQGEAYVDRSTGEMWFYDGGQWRLEGWPDTIKPDDPAYETVLMSGEPGPLGPLRGDSAHHNPLVFKNDARWIDSLPNTLTFTQPDGPFCRIEFGEDGAAPTVWVDPDLAWDQAAKMFWNAVYRMAGRPALFPD